MVTVPAERPMAPKEASRKSSKGVSLSESSTRMDRLDDVEVEMEVPPPTPGASGTEGLCQGSHPGHSGPQCGHPECWAGKKLTSQVCQMGDCIKELEDQLEKAGTSAPASGSRTGAGNDSETRIVPVAALHDSQRNQVALIRRCGAYATRAAVGMEELGRLAFVCHLEQEHCSELTCKCLEQATNSVKALSIETKVQVKLSEVVRAVDYSKYYGQFRVPDVAPPVKPDQAAEEAYVRRDLIDLNFRLVKIAAIMAQRGQYSRGQGPPQGIHASLYVVDEDAPASVPPGAGHSPMEDETSQSDS